MITLLALLTAAILSPACAKPEETDSEAIPEEGSSSYAEMDFEKVLDIPDEGDGMVPARVIPAQGGYILLLSDQIVEERASRSRVVYMEPDAGGFLTTIHETAPGAHIVDLAANDSAIAWFEEAESDGGAVYRLSAVGRTGNGAALESGPVTVYEAPIEGREIEVRQPRAGLVGDSLFFLADDDTEKAVSLMEYDTVTRELSAVKSWPYIESESGLRSPVSFLHVKAAQILVGGTDAGNRPWFSVFGTADFSTTLNRSIDMAVQEVMAADYDETSGSFAAYYRSEDGAYRVGIFPSGSDSVRNVFPYGAVNGEEPYDPHEHRSTVDGDSVTFADGVCLFTLRSFEIEEEMSYAHVVDVKNARQPVIARQCYRLDWREEGLFGLVITDDGIRYVRFSGWN